MMEAAEEQVKSPVPAEEAAVDLLPIMLAMDSMDLPELPEALEAMVLEDGEALEAMLGHKIMGRTALCQEAAAVVEVVGYTTAVQERPVRSL
jgi:hypothetical protein